ncbi:MAG: response regulator, partial [Verrucomicrobiota bacterium]
RRLKALIVEDDLLTARDIESILRRRGHDFISIARDRDEARAQLDAEPFGLVILDIHLGQDNSGLALAATIASHSEITLVLITGYAPETLPDSITKLQPAALIRKPFTEEEVNRRLDSVTEQETARRALEKRLPGFATTSEALLQGVIVSDLGGRVVYLNPAAERLVGHSLSDARNQPLETIAPLEPAAGAPSTDRGAHQVFLQPSRGSAVLVEERSAPIKTSADDPLGVITVLSVAANQESDPEGIADPAIIASGPSQDLSTDSMPAPPARAAALEKIAAIAADPGFRALVRRPTSAGGSDAADAASAEDRATPNRLDSPAPSPSNPDHKMSVATSEDPIEMLGTGVDEAIPQSLMEEVRDPIVVLDGEGFVEYANAEAEQAFATGKPLCDEVFWDFFAARDYDEYDEHFIKPIVLGRQHHFEFRDTTRSRWYDVRAYQARRGVLCFFHDITDSKIEAHESLRRQRLEGLGLLARGFAHDFNNHLTTVTGNLGLAREFHPDDEEHQSYLREAEAASRRAASLVQQLLTFAQGGQPIRETTRLPQLVRRKLGELRAQNPEIRFELKTEQPDLAAHVDPSQMARLLENLMLNAIAAMPDGGTLLVRCGSLEQEQVSEIKADFVAGDEAHFLLEVIDTGEGMSADALDQVFEPYYTTRKDQNASGIGLTVCESIAKAHQGFLQLQSKQGRGTIATFCAPIGVKDVASDSGESTGFADRSTAGASRSGPLLRPGETEARVLILEDDAPIRRLLATTLRKQGHEVVETVEGLGAVEAYREAFAAQRPFHLFISDLTIENGVGGLEAMAKIREIDPAVVAVVSSGYSDAPAMAEPDRFGFRAVLPKPYTPQELRSLVSRVLEGEV